MKIFLKKYAFVLIPLFLCVLTISFRPVPLKASGCVDTTTGESVSCDDPNATLQPTNPAPVVDTTPTAGGTLGSPNAQSNVIGSPNTTSGSNNVTGEPNTKAGSTDVNPSSGTFYLQNPLSSQFTTVGGIVGGFIQIFVYLVVLFAVVMIIYVGLMLVLAQGNTEELKKRKDQLLMLVIGLAIVIGARIIVQVVISTLQSTNMINPNVINSAQNASKGL